MSRKIFVQVSVFTLLLLALLAIPASAQAGGVCGGTYVVQWGDTVSSIAQRCGTTVSAIYAANPGIGRYLYAGQPLIVPGYNSCNSCPPLYYKDTYVVRYGDTFAKIANRFGVSVYELWAANPHIWDINVIYVGQVLSVPSSSWHGHDNSWDNGVTYPETPEHLSYGTYPDNTSKVKVKLVNKANADVYVSLQGTTKDGFEVVNEYTVTGSMTVTVPKGWYTYVAWVGGEQYSGQFSMNGGRTITFYTGGRIVVE